MKKVLTYLLLFAPILSFAAQVQQIGGSQVWTNNVGVIQPTTNAPVLSQFGITVGTNTSTYWGSYAGAGGESFLSLHDPSLGEAQVNEFFVGAGATDGSGPNSQIDLRPATNALNVDMIWNDVNGNDSGLRVGASSAGVSLAMRTNSHPILNFDTTLPGSDLTNSVGGFSTPFRIISGGMLVRSNTLASIPTLAKGDTYYWSSNGVAYVICSSPSGTLTTNKLGP